MNSVQLARLSLAGKSLGRKLMEQRMSEAAWDFADPDTWRDDDDIPYAQLADDGDQDKRKQYFKRLNPDSAIHSYGDSSQFTAFIYSATSDTLYCQPGDKYHGDGVGERGGSYGSGSDLQAIYDEKNAQGFFGRFGMTEKNGGFVTIWGKNSDHQGSKKYYEIKLGTPNQMKKMLAGMVSGTTKIHGDCPAKYPITKDYIFTDSSDYDSPPRTIEEILGPDAGGEQGNETCRRLAQITVTGRPMDLGTLQGNIHMVKGKAFDDMKAAFCSQHEKLKKDLEASGCDGAAQRVTDILSRLNQVSGGCSDSWDKLKADGAAALRRDYRDMFDKQRQYAQSDAGPEEDYLDREFRGRQKDIDAAWDFTRGKRESRHYASKHSFRDYVNLKEARQHR